MPAGGMAVGGALALGGGIGQNFSGKSANQQAGAYAQQGAEQQFAFAQAQQAQEVGYAQQNRTAAMGAAAPTLQELTQLDQQVQLSARSIQRQEQLLSAVDPALIEAGKQALGLLQGQDAKVLAPLQRERARQKSIYENQLRDQLGSGYATSTAGQEALNRFDEQTANVMSGAQQSATNSLLGLSASVRPNENALQDLSAAPGRSMAALQNRQLGAVLGTPLGFRTNAAQYAGGGAFAQANTAYRQGQAAQDFYGGLSKLGGTVFGAASAGGGGFGGGASGGQTGDFSALGQGANRQNASNPFTLGDLE